VAEDVTPSPKFQSRDDIVPVPPVEASVKVTDSGAVPLVTDGVNEAIGGSITVIVAEAESITPSELVTVNVTI
jgi:hypothetical protein